MFICLFNGSHKIESSELKKLWLSSEFSLDAFSEMSFRFMTDFECHGKRFLRKYGRRSNRLSRATLVNAGILFRRQFCTE
jgi:hypothetical protein